MFAIADSLPDLPERVAAARLADLTHGGLLTHVSEGAYGVA